MSGTLRHGRYSKVRRAELRELIAEMEADPDPLNMFSELAAARALLIDFINRHAELNAALLAWHEDPAAGQRPASLLDITNAIGFIETISRICYRIEKLRNASAVSRPELFRVLEAMGRAVKLEVEALVRQLAPDDSTAASATLLRLRDRWMEIRL